MMINNVKCIIDAIVETCIYHKTTPKVRVDTEKLFIVSTGPSSKRFWEEPEFRTAFFEYEICILNDAFFRYKKEIFTLRVILELKSDLHIKRSLFDIVKKRVLVFFFLRRLIILRLFQINIFS